MFALICVFQKNLNENIKLTIKINMDIIEMMTESSKNNK
jgi:hypothetical protein